MKLTNKFLSEVARGKESGPYFWKQVENSFIAGVSEDYLLHKEGVTKEEIQETRGMMVKRTAYYDLVEPCTQFLFAKTAQELAEKIDIEKIPLQAFKQVDMKAGKIITAENEFFMWYINPDPKFDQITVSHFFIDKDEFDRDVMMHVYSTIDFSYDGTGEAKMRTNPYDPYSKELDRRITQYLFYLFLAENSQVEILPGQTNGKTKKQGKVLNDWTSPVIHVTSAWSHEYVGVVSGHWRHQPYGPREQPKIKLIYIKPFQKKYGARKDEI